MAKANTFTLPGTAQDAQARREVLAKVVAAQQPFVDQLARLLEAKDLHRNALAELVYLNENFAAIQQADWDRTVDAITIVRIAQVDPVDESPIASQNVTFTYKGATTTKPLYLIDREVLAAIAADETKIPLRIRGLGDTAANALDNWTQHRRRGFVSR